MRKKSLLFLPVVLIAAVLFGGCDRVSTADITQAAQNAEYATENRLTALEYSLYINKQITNFAAELTTRMLATEHIEDRELEAELANASKKTMQDIYEEISVTYPAEGQDDDKDLVLSAMDAAISHIEDYTQALNDGEDISAYKSTFQSDFNSITGLSSLYYQ